MQMLKHFLRALDDMAVSTGMANLHLDAEILCAHALRVAGRRAFRGASFQAPLQFLLECYDREAELNVIGRFGARWDALRCLSNLLRFETEEERDSAILMEPIERPIFITGFPRSGTTLLHTLLAQDSAVRAPRCWETMSLYPLRGNGRDKRRGRVDRQLRMFQALAPQMAMLHPLSADGPQECTEITAQIFQSLRYEMTHRVPSYQRWLDRAGHLAAYRFHKRFLQHLQHQQHGGRWILKSPDHIHALHAIETVYPDCGIVLVHRDPVRVAASAMKLTEVVRRPFTRHLDKAEIGRQVLGRVVEAAETLVAREKSGRAGHVFHVHYVEFARDPMGTIEALYRYFDLPMTSQTYRRMRAYLAGMPVTGNSYGLEEFGLDPVKLCAQFEFYLDHFDVRREFAAWRKFGAARAPVAA
jgi:hypothetical protein